MSVNGISRFVLLYMGISEADVHKYLHEQSLTYFVSCTAVALFRLFRGCAEVSVEVIT